MSRSVDLWIGKTDDTPIPPRIRLRVFDRCKGRCGQCGRQIRAGKRWTCEHLKALINGGKNAEDNLGVTCSWCLPTKNATDIAEKSKTASLRKKHFGIKRKSRPMPGSKASGWRKRMDGTVERR